MLVKNRELVVVQTQEQTTDISVLVELKFNNENLKSCLIRALVGAKDSRRRFEILASYANDSRVKFTVSVQ